MAAIPPNMDESNYQKTLNQSSNVNFNQQFTQLIPQSRTNRPEEFGNVINVHSSAFHQYSKPPPVVGFHPHSIMPPVPSQQSYGFATPSFIPNQNSSITQSGNQRSAPFFPPVAVNSQSPNTEAIAPAYPPKIAVPNGSMGEHFDPYMSSQSPKSYASGPVNDFAGSYKMGGNYPGGMGSMQQDFTKLGISETQGTSKTVDLMNEKNLLQYGNDNVEIVLPPTVCNSEVHCSPNVFRCTMQAIPQTRELLKKSRLLLGLTLQPFRDTKNLSVIQPSTIVRCRVCRTYINPYVYFTDTRHWKCNLCARVNDVPEDFCWDPVTKTMGEPIRRPEIKNATIEFVAPSEYMLRAPQPAVYLFVFDVSTNAVETGYLYTFTEQLLIALSRLPGDERTLIGFIGVDSAIHFFQFFDKIHRQLVVDDIEDCFLPVNRGLLVNLRQNFDSVVSFVERLPTLFETNSSNQNCLGSALNAAYKLIKDIGGRITVLQTKLPDLGPGSLVSREDPNQRASEDVKNICPATDFYKSFALECTGNQIAIDIFLLNTYYSDLATLADAARFSSGCIYHYPNYHIVRDHVQVKRFQKQFYRYLTRKIGFEAVLRIRCTKGLSPHTFYGNFFVRSTDLLTLPNTNPDASLGVQLQMEEDLIGLSTVCFQAALLYTSSKGDRRIRVHTLCLPITKDLPVVFSNFDSKCAVSLLARMAVERSFSDAGLSDSREAMVNSVVDSFRAYNDVVGHGYSSSLLSPKAPLSLLPLYMLGMLKHSAFSCGTSIKLDNRVSAMLFFNTAPLDLTILEFYPSLYSLSHFLELDSDPPQLHLSYSSITGNQVYLLDSGSFLYIFVTNSVPQSVLIDLFQVDRFEDVDEEKTFELYENRLSERVNDFIRRITATRSLFAPVVVMRVDSPVREVFTRRLVEDRTTSSYSLIEFLQFVKKEIHK